MIYNGETLQVLFIEDNPDDVNLLVIQLGKTYKLVWQRVDTEASLIISLDNQWDIILCDFRMPNIDAMKCLKLVKASSRNFDTPFIVISGVVDETSVVELFTSGAKDFIPKDNYIRLSFAIRRELKSRKERLAERARSRIMVKEALDQTILSWGKALETRDQFSSGHTIRVTDLALRLAVSIGIPHADFVDLQRGSLLHDIGKIGIPDAILLKPDQLTFDEMEIMKLHSKLAYDMVKEIPSLESASLIPYCHHERWNGTGYPQGLAGSDNPFPNGTGIPMLARLFSVVDVYDALTSERPYRNSWEKYRAIAYIMDESKITFDPQMVDAFVDMIGRG